MDSTHTCTHTHNMLSCCVSSSLAYFCPWHRPLAVGAWYFLDITVLTQHLHRQHQDDKEHSCCAALLTVHSPRMCPPISPDWGPTHTHTHTHTTHIHVPHASIPHLRPLGSRPRHTDGRTDSNLAKTQADNDRCPAPFLLFYVCTCVAVCASPFWVFEVRILDGQRLGERRDAALSAVVAVVGTALLSERLIRQHTHRFVRVYITVCVCVPLLLRCRSTDVTTCCTAAPRTRTPPSTPTANAQHESSRACT